MNNDRYIFLRNRQRYSKGNKELEKEIGKEYLRKKQTKSNKKGGEMKVCQND